MILFLPFSYPTSDENFKLINGFIDLDILKKKEWISWLRRSLGSVNKVSLPICVTSLARKAHRNTFGNPFRATHPLNLIYLTSLDL